jgi:hypothetical protein
VPSREDDKHGVPKVAGSSSQPARRIRSEPGPSRR